MSILVHFSFSEVIDDEAHESFYEMKVFVYDTNLLCFLFGLFFANVGLAEADCALFDSFASIKGI